MAGILVVVGWVLWGIGGCEFWSVGNAGGGRAVKGYVGQLKIKWEVLSDKYKFLRVGGLRLAGSTENEANLGLAKFLSLFSATLGYNFNLGDNMVPEKIAARNVQRTRHQWVVIFAIN